jgi:serine/threonine protein kinase
MFFKVSKISSITFESNSHLIRIESEVFYETSLQSILIPSTILFMASDAVKIASQVRLVDGDSCAEFDRWLQVKRLCLGIDFRRIPRMGFDIPCLGDYVINFSMFEERSIICESDEVPNQIYCRIEDQFLVFMKSKPLSTNVEVSRIENELDKFINLRHPCIIAPIGFVVRIESDILEDLKIVRLYSEGCSLAEILSIRPVWWTSTVKAKAVAGIVLGLRFVHSFGLFHGHLTTNNILFDLDDCIQIVDFEPILLEDCEDESESDEKTLLGAFQKKDGNRKLIFGRLRQFFLN